MKKMLMTLVILGVMAPMCFIGCGGGGGSTAPAPAPVVSAQTRFPMTGTIKEIAEAGGSVISGASVVLMDASSGATYNDVTDDNGAFSFSGLPTGNYTLGISSTGASQDFTAISQSVVMTATATLEILATPEYSFTLDAVNVNDYNESFDGAVIRVECSNGFVGTVTTAGAPATLNDVPHSSACTAQVTNLGETNPRIGTDSATKSFAATGSQIILVEGTKPRCWSDTVATDSFCAQDPDIGIVTPVCDYSGTAEAAVRCVEN